MSSKFMPISELTFRPIHVDLDFHSITHQVEVKGKQIVIINNASGSFKHGKLHAIMGPSGCGKSSLLNVLAGFNPVASGTIQLNGATFPVVKWPKMISPVRSYILQDDFLIAELTVLEQLTYSVDLKVPNETSQETRRSMVQTLLARTHLKDCSNRLIGVLSGGQRKRVSVASELANYPPVLFLDEPTTGLDSTSCYRLVELLKSLAQSGCNVIATIHQPNSRVFAMFDTLTVLYNGGVIAYNGPAIALAESLQRINNMVVTHLENPAEILFEGTNIKKMADADPDYRRKVIDEAAEVAASKRVLCRKSWAKIEGDDGFNDAVFETNIYSDSTSEDLIGADEAKLLCKTQLPSSWSRFKSFFRRTLVQTKRDIVFFLGRVITYVCATSLIGIVFQNVGTDGASEYANVALMFVIVKIFTLGTSIVAVMTSQYYLEVLLREHINSLYGISSFFITRTVLELVINIFLSAVLTVGLWMMSGQQQTDVVMAFFSASLVTCLHCIGIHQISFILGMFSDKASLPQLPFAIVMLHCVSGGFFVRFDDLPVWFHWTIYVCFGSFTYTALMKLAYQTITPGHPVNIPCKSGHPLCNRFATGADALHERGINTEVSYWTDIEALACYAIGITFCAWALLIVYLRKAKRRIARL